MLKTNSRKAKETIKHYIMENFNAENYTAEKIEGWDNISRYIYNIFRREAYSTKEDKRFYKTEKDAFFYFVQGLPSILDCSFVYNVSAVDTLGEILEESEEEKARYTEEQAEELLIALIYREIKSR